jgi:hypothetical protein
VLDEDPYDKPVTLAEIRAMANALNPVADPEFH